jgi:hypothetical protein
MYLSPQSEIKSVGRFYGQLMDRRPSQIDGGRRQAGRFRNAPALLNDRSANRGSASTQDQARKSFNALS